ncbi:nucleotide exchange factor GrpE [Canibacter zhoujuaniae]|uniref:nucleotide exchange factor GrpE n=1 Tax=Canibacter zhoujuaniae TaxID=2708343 RepID=UPI001421178B|nr:nucleotide exchange factor GrpE [Canibacter zhoujuaniae]
MTNEEQRPEGEEVPQAEGPAADATGPAAHEEQTADGANSADFTVADILDAEQTAEAKAAGAQTANDAAEAVADEEAADPQENPYLEDLRRLTAEYANYRKRTEANAEIERDRAKASIVLSLLGVLDDFDRAEQHGDLPEGSAVAAIAQKLRTTLEKMGLVAFGEKGEQFDPQQHEAIAQVPVPGQEPNTVLDVVERGYRLGNVELRPAKVAVVAADG